MYKGKKLLEGRIDHKIVGVKKVIRKEKKREEFETEEKAIKAEFFDIIGWP